MPESIATIFVDRQDGCHFAITVEPRIPLLIGEEGGLSEVVERLREKLSVGIELIGPGGVARTFRMPEEDVEAFLRDVIATMSPRHEDLDKVIERRGAPAAWGGEPAWADL